MSEIDEIRAEIVEIKAGIELCKIQMELTRLCHAENLNLVVVDRLVNRCRISDEKLLIVDDHGVPLTFEEAVCGLRGD